MKKTERNKNLIIKIGANADMHYFPYFALASNYQKHTSDFKDWRKHVGLGQTNYTAILTLRNTNTLFPTSYFLNTFLMLLKQGTANLSLNWKTRKSDRYVAEEQAVYQTLTY